MKTIFRKYVKFALEESNFTKFSEFLCLSLCTCTVIVSCELEYTKLFHFWTTCNNKTLFFRVNAFLKILENFKTFAAYRLLLECRGINHLIY